jgi:hypothetical protein
LGYVTLVEPKQLEVNQVVVNCRGLPSTLDGLRIVHLTDLHRSRFVSSRYLEQAIEVANDQRPDLIVFTGDYITHGRTPRGNVIYGTAAGAQSLMADAARCMGKARARYGVFASLGNHDHWHDGDGCARAIAEAGVPVLRNESAMIEVKGTTVPVVGLGDLWTEGVNFQKAFARVTQPFSVVLMHNPDSFEHWPRNGGHLILSGHTHGGQVNIPFMGAPIVPSRYGQKYAHGLIGRGDCWMYVSRGIGLIYPPVRFNCRPEIAVLEVRCA